MEDPLEHLHLVMWGFVPSACLRVAIERRIFDLIDAQEKCSLESIADALSWNPRPTAALLGVLTSLRFLELDEESNTWSLNSANKKWLLRTGTQYLGKFIERSGRLMKSYENLDAVLAREKPDSKMFAEAIDAFGRDEKMTRDFGDSMQAMAIELAADVVQRVDLGSNSSMLDVGCGHGVFAIEFAERWPDLHCDLFDLPAVVRVADSRVKASGYGTRLKVVAGDWRQGLPQKQYSVALLSQVLHEEDEEGAEALLKAAAESLVDTGQLIVIGFLGNSLCDSGLLPGYFSVNMLVELGAHNPSLDWISVTAERFNIAAESVFRTCGGRTVWVGRKDG